MLSTDGAQREIGEEIQALNFHLSEHWFIVRLGHHVSTLVLRGRASASEDIPPLTRGRDSIYPILHRRYHSFDGKDELQKIMFDEISIEKLHFYHVSYQLLSGLSSSFIVLFSFHAIWNTVIAG